MSKILAITPSFSAWRGAADRLLTLETALAFSKRTALLGPVHLPEELEVEKVRLRAEELFRIAEAETNALRGQLNTTATKRHPFDNVAGGFSHTQPGSGDPPRGNGGSGTPGQHTS